MFSEKEAFKIFKKLTRKHLCQTLAQVFSCKFVEIFKNTFLHGTLPLAASEYWKEKKNRKVHIVHIFSFIFFTNQVFWYNGIRTNLTDTDVFKRHQDVLKRSRHLTTKPDVVKTSTKRRQIYDVLKTSYLHRLEDVQFTTSWRRLIYDVLRTSDLRCLEDVRFATPWRHPIYNVFKTSVKGPLYHNFVVMPIQRQKKLFFLILYCLKY